MKKVLKSLKNILFNNKQNNVDPDVFEYRKDYDKNGRLTHSVKICKLERWWEYDERGNMIYYKNSKGDECWLEYDENNNLIHYKDDLGIETNIREKDEYNE